MPIKLLLKSCLLVIALCLTASSASAQSGGIAEGGICISQADGCAKGLICQKKKDSAPGFGFDGTCVPDPLCRKLEAPLPQFGDQKFETVCDFIPENVQSGQVQQALTPYVNTIVAYLIAAVVVAGLIVIVVAGYIYMTAGGDASKVDLSKKLIFGAIIGIVIALGYFVILNTINPGIVGA